MRDGNGITSLLKLNASRDRDQCAGKWQTVITPCLLESLPKKEDNYDFAWSQDFIENIQSS